MVLEEIHFHDSRIRRVTELPARDMLVFEVDYPIDWENNVFAIRFITFIDVLEYSVDEGAFFGGATLLDYTVDAVESGRRRITLHTNAGKRSLSFREVQLSDSFDSD